MFSHFGPRDVIPDYLWIVLFLNKISPQKLSLKEINRTYEHRFVHVWKRIMTVYIVPVKRYPLKGDFEED